MSEAHKALTEVFGGADPHSLGLLNLLRDIYPAFEKRLFQNNRFMEILVKSGYNPMDIMDYPVCGSCETLAPWDTPYVDKQGIEHKRCTCMATGCGKSTIDPITTRQWIQEELKHKAPPDIAMIAEFATDVVAARMMRLAYQKYDKIVNGKNQREEHKIYFANGMSKKV